jgi:hypothetical protein
MQRERSAIHDQSAHQQYESGVEWTGVKWSGVEWSGVEKRAPGRGTKRAVKTKSTQKYMQY